MSTCPHGTDGVLYSKENSDRWEKSSDCDDTHPHIPPHMDGLWMRDNNGTGPQVQVYVHGKDGEMLTVPRIDQDG